MFRKRIVEYFRINVLPDTVPDSNQENSFIPNRRQIKHEFGDR